MTNKANLFLVITICIVCFGCSKEEKPTTVPLVSPICEETPPVNEVCLAYFIRWFYNKDKNKCEQIGYGGCSQKGFETQNECESCKCK